MRTIVISDCHGNPKLITNALEHVSYNRDVDRLIFAGDLVDIGAWPYICRDLLRDNGAEMLWGNHDYAILMTQLISPQDGISWQFEDWFADMFFTREWKLATQVDGVLITHAGVSQAWWKQFESVDKDVEEFSWLLNELFWHVSGELLADPLPREAGILEYDARHRQNVFMGENSPLWWRPDGVHMPLPGVRQVFGHTPPELVTGRYPDVHIIDPFAREALYFNKVDERFRYALIEDGVVTVHDSLHYVGQ